jgi:gamma-glutamylcyclotransferase (GGCT)/AIG2-like uncharacterized protein YtfP
MNSLFAYGTLRDSDVLEGVLGHGVPPARLRTATARGYAVVFFPGRTYPAIRRDESDTALGILVDDISEAEWLRLDTFEGDEYRRAPIEITVDGRPAIADAYWPAIDIGLTPPWRFEDWQARSKAGLLAAARAAAPLSPSD